MLTMLIMIALMVGIFRLFGFGLRILGGLIGWIIGAAVVIAVLGGMITLITAVAGLTVYLLPVILLVGAGIFIGRRIGSSGVVDNLRDNTREAIDANYRVIR